MLRLAHGLLWQALWPGRHVKLCRAQSSPLSARAAGPSKPVVQADGGQPLAFQPAAAFGPIMDAVYSRLREAMAPIPGAFVEHNKFCVSVHYRNCAPGAASQGLLPE